MWVNGQIIGNPEAQEQLGVVADWLGYMASAAGRRPASVFQDLDAQSRLSLFEWWFSESIDEPPCKGWSRPNLDANAYFLPHIQSGSAPDHWWAILMETEVAEAITWRPPESTSVREALWPRGTFADVVLPFVDWLKAEWGKGDRRIFLTTTNSGEGRCERKMRLSSSPLDEASHYEACLSEVKTADLGRLTFWLICRCRLEGGRT